jgi:hypothetical protein
MTTQTIVKPVPLTGGTIKQIAWAERIRSRVLRMVPSHLADELSQVRSAQFWLAHRERTPEERRGIRAGDQPGLISMTRTLPALARPPPRHVDRAP